MIDLQVGSAVEMISKINEPVGLAFIDANKREYWQYYDNILSALAPEGVIVVDNTSLLGSVLLHGADLSNLPPFAMTALP